MIICKDCEYKNECDRHAKYCTEGACDHYLENPQATIYNILYQVRTHLTSISRYINFNKPGNERYNKLKSEEYHTLASKATDELLKYINEENPDKFKIGRERKITVRRTEDK
jgi:hypothetical protein